MTILMGANLLQLLSESADAQRKCELLSKQEAQLKAQVG